MVDDCARSREQVSQWIHDHEPEMSGLTITWSEAEQPDEAAHLRMLEMLFSPRPPSAAA